MFFERRKGGVPLLCRLQAAGNGGHTEKVQQAAAVKSSEGPSSSGSGGKGQRAGPSSNGDPLHPEAWKGWEAPTLPPRNKPMHITDIDWRDSQEQVVYIVMSYLESFTSVMRMRSRSKVQDHIHGYNDLLVDLQRMGEELSDIKKVMHLLHSLAPSYQTLITILLHRDNKAVTYNEVVSAYLVDEVEQEMLSFSRPLTSNTALPVTRGQSQPSGLDNLQRT
ncbi:hypothetical protein AXG93_285s1420 [Marchantia polymorpha subsp. ruderalis]|uniref:Uncharacterized protein n=1 Tax=Marchantia polymorpha subsp. ruderalis TaxID=1480154 RepID=A0A176VRF0_MARPO|nr:hypothetical protein AXG93_285s1420 [Marchantia polymorpha subsp. ruderalis]